eukprot:7472923-Prorocentrum_lima.AAC.1
MVDGQAPIIGEGRPGKKKTRRQKWRSQGANRQYRLLPGRSIRAPAVVCPTGSCLQRRDSR